MRSLTHLDYPAMLQPRCRIFLSESSTVDDAQLEFEIDDPLAPDITRGGDSLWEYMPLFQTHASCGLPHGAFSGDATFYCRVVFGLGVFIVRCSRRDSTSDNMWSGFLESTIRPSSQSSRLYRFGLLDKAGLALPDQRRFNGPYPAGFAVLEAPRDDAHPRPLRVTATVCEPVGLAVDLPRRIGWRCEAITVRTRLEGGECYLSYDGLLKMVMLVLFDFPLQRGQQLSGGRVGTWEDDDGNTISCSAVDDALSEWLHRGERGMLPDVNTLTSRTELSRFGLQWSVPLHLALRKAFGGRFFRFSTTMSVNPTNLGELVQVARLE